jgi:hypothetical protein
MLLIRPSLTSIYLMSLLRTSIVLVGQQDSRFAANATLEASILEWNTILSTVVLSKYSYNIRFTSQKYYSTLVVQNKYSYCSSTVHVESNEDIKGTIERF